MAQNEEIRSREAITKAIDKLCELGKTNGFRVVRPTDFDYEWGREISNSRIQHRPAAVALPKTAEQVADCVRCCTRHNVALRVRSGGHHHEGMSSLDDGIMIRLSELCGIEYPKGTENNPDFAWIGVGTPLKHVYDELEKKGRTIPGGGCWSVNVGGLTLGGGWGTSIRHLGLTCDNFEEAEIVNADAKILRVVKKDDSERLSEDEKEKDDHQDLIWALRGGGGGNFGIVTRFRFRLSKLADPMSDFEMHWSDRDQEELTDIVTYYLEHQPKWDLKLTTAMGLRVKHDFISDEKYRPVGLSGVCYGSDKFLLKQLAPLLEAHPPTVFDVAERYPPQVASSSLESDEFSGNSPATLSSAEPEKAIGPEAAPGAATELSSSQISEGIHRVINSIYSGEPAEEPDPAPKDSDYTRNAPPTVTCTAPWPHKISSGFPVKGGYRELAREMVEIIKKTNRDEEKNAARLYMVLHAMPGPQGKVQPEESAFFWRNKDFLLQFQAWWSRPPLEDNPKSKGASKIYKSPEAYEKDQDRYIEWIRAARRTLAEKGLLEGAFINFVDKEIPVEDYYGENFNALKRIKAKYDPSNVFTFPLAIPVEDPPTE